MLKENDRNFYMKFVDDVGKKPELVPDIFALAKQCKIDVLVGGSNFQSGFLPLVVQLCMTRQLSHVISLLLRDNQCPNFRK